MRLTNDDRDAFVRAVMDDVPETDYDALARKEVMAWVATKLPPKVRAVWDDPELRGFIKCNKWNSMPGELDSIYTPSIEGDFPAKLMKALDAYGTACSVQYEERKALKQKVWSTIAACSTLKQAKERLPEFEKYLPADRDGSGLANLPAVANVVADLTKAGWPKGEAKK